MSAHTIQLQGIKTKKKKKDILSCIFYTAATASYFTDEDC